MWLEWSLSVPFQNCARLLCHPFKMAAVTKNRYFFNCLFCFILSQNELTFKLHLHENKLFNVSSLFFCEIFLSSYLYWLCIFLYKKNHIKILCIGIFCWNEFRLHTFQIMCDIHPPFKKAAIRNFIKLKKKNKQIFL